jgi:hypothetical protein
MRPNEMRAASTSSCPCGSLVAIVVLEFESIDLFRGLSCAIASCDTFRTRPWMSSNVFDFDLALWAFVNEADVPVGDHGLDLKVAVGRYRHHQSLSRSYHPACTASCWTVPSTGAVRT